MTTTPVPTRRSRRVAVLTGILAAVAIGVAVGQTGHADGTPDSCAASGQAWPTDGPAATWPTDGPSMTWPTDRASMAWPTDGPAASWSTDGPTAIWPDGPTAPACR
jgi:hypothetical protein